jgi:glycosyltransferase involved in cell wall biosynthesis
MDDDSVEVSVVIPSLNEERTIGICIEKVKKVFREHDIKGEIIVADNSSDRTPEIARSLGAKVVTPDKRGYGYAYLYGFRYARGKYIVIGDADNTYDFLEIPKLLEPLKKGEADLVIGSRFKGKILKGAMPWLHRYIGNPILTWFLNFFFKAGVSDAHSGFRAFTREALEKMNLRCHGMEFASEMIIRAVWAGLRIKEVPITYYPRQAESKLHSFRDGWRHLKFMLLYASSYLFILPGMSLFTLGMVLALLISVGLAGFGSISLGIHSLIASSLLAIVGYQLIFLGLAGKIYRAKIDIQNDRIAEFFTKRLSLEKGATIGLLIFLAGFAYTAYLVWKWIDSGFKNLPMLYQDILSFTLLVIGLQTIFSSFFLSMLSERI